MDIHRSGINEEIGTIYLTSHILEETDLSKRSRVLREQNILDPETAKKAPR